MLEESIRAEERKMLEAQRSLHVPGAKDDAGKRRWDMLPMKGAGEVVDVLTYGAAKYTPNGWRSVPEAKARYTAAAFRH